MMSFRKIKRPWARISFFLVILLAAIAVPVLPQLISPGTASADSQNGFHYVDDKYSAISGSVLVNGGLVTFKKSGSTTYDGGTPSGLGCHATITVSKAGATSGTLTFSSCLQPTDNKSQSVSIAKAQKFVGTWVDHNHILVNGVTYADGQTDNNDLYTADSPSDGCSDSNSINGFPGGGGDPANATATATITVYTAPSNLTTQSCDKNQYSITFNQPQNYSAYFVWVDSGTIQTADGKTMTLVQDSSGGLYKDDGSGAGGSATCVSTINADPKNPGHGTLILRYSAGNPLNPGFSPQMVNPKTSQSGGCSVSDPMQINIGGVANASKAAGTGDTSANGNNSGSVPTLSCNVSFNPLTWVVCPAVQGMVSIIGDLDNAINSQLSVGTPGNSDDPNQIFCDSNTASQNGGQQAVSNCEAYYSAWSSFRDIALGLLAIVGLVIIISEMSGLEFFDAYTIRKVLPRLIFAAIAITLSWQLMQFFVTLTNDLGYGIRWLIYQPFVKAGIDTATLNGTGATAVSLATGTAIIALSIFGLLSFAATAALAVFLAFLTLIIRQLLIIVLVIIAPIAIIAYVLPNTQNAYKLWWSTFSKTLLMFPLIAAFIAAGRVFAAVSSNSSSGILGQLMGYAAYFAPYFLIPLTFRFAGGAISAIGGFMNDRGRGAFDRLGQFRKQRFDKNMHDLAAGNRYKADNFAANAFNRTTRGIATIPKAGVMPNKWRSRFQAGMASHEQSAIRDYMENNEEFKAISANDDYLQATMASQGGGESEDDWRRYLSAHGYSGRSLEQGVALIREAKRATNNEVFHAAAVAANFGTGTGFQEGGIGSAMAAINEVSGADRDKANFLTGLARGTAERNQRQDLAFPGFGTHSVATQQMYEQFQAIDNDQTLGAEQKADRKEALEQQFTTDMLERGFYTHGGGAGAIIQSRGQSVKQIAPRIVTRLSNAHNALASAQHEADQAEAAGNTDLWMEKQETADKRERELMQEYAAIGNLQDQMNYASPEVARILSDTLFESKINGNDPASPTVSQNLSRIKASNNPHYMQARNDFDARQAAERQAAAQQGLLNTGGGPGGTQPPGPGAPGQQ